MVESRPENRALRISGGGTGSGGHVTLTALREHSTAYKAAISIDNTVSGSALEKLTDGSLDAFFIMDGPDSEKIAEILGAVDAQGEKLYKFIEVDPGRDFFRNNNESGLYPQYFTVEVELPGLWNDYNTIGTPAVIIVSKAFRNSADGSELTTAVRTAAEQAEADIKAETRTAPDWSLRPTNR